jgi:hypothetical protein
MDDEEARGEAPLHTSQSSEARLGRLTGAVAVEQLSFLSFGRIGAGAREPRLDEDFVPPSSGLAPRRCRRSWYPPFAKNAKDGAPTVLTASAKSKPGPPATLPGQESLAEHSLLANHRKWKTNTITEKKAIRYAATQPNLRHSRLDFGHHAQQAYPASRAFGPRIKTCNHVGQAE